MRRPGLRLLGNVAVALAWLAVLAAVPAHAARPGPRQAALQHDLDELVASGAMGAIAEIRDGRASWHGTSGVAEAGTSTPVRTDARFRIGSVTKTFVATVVLQLAAEGRLRLDDPVQRWLPGVLRDGVTVRQLLSHTSGLYDYTESLPLRDPAGFLAIRWRTWTPAQLLGLTNGHPALFEPGTDSAYSSTDYILLGLLVERVTGRAYGTEIAHRILRPLHLTGTSVPGTSPRIPGPHAHGYLPLPTGLVDITEFNPSASWAAGEMISTTADLNRFIRAVLDGRLLPAAQLRQLLTPPSAARDYGLGVERKVLPCGDVVYGHEGDTPGFSAWTYGTADGRRTVTVSVTWGEGRARNVDALLTTALCD